MWDGPAAAAGAARLKLEEPVLRCDTPAADEALCSKFAAFRRRNELPPPSLLNAKY